MSARDSFLDSRHQVRMTGRVYLRAIVPIGILYSASLVCSNLVYLYLSVAFIQMLKAENDNAYDAECAGVPGIGAECVADQKHPHLGASGRLD